MLTTTAAGRIFDYSYCIGMVACPAWGSADPVDFAMAANGVVYVINRGAEELGQRISKCTVDHQFLGQYGGLGSGDGQFTWPMSIDLDQDENLYVGDEYLQRISIFDKDGKFLAKWGTAGQWRGGTPRSIGPGLRPRGQPVHCGQSQQPRPEVHQRREIPGQVGAARPGRGRVRYALGDLPGQPGRRVCRRLEEPPCTKILSRLEHSWPPLPAPSGSGADRRPTGVAVDSEGDVYVTDWHTTGCRSLARTVLSSPRW